MAGPEHAIRFRDSRNRVRFSVGLLSGPVYECVNVGTYASKMNIGQAVALEFAEPSPLDESRPASRIPPFLPDPAEPSDRPGTVLAVSHFSAHDFSAGTPPIGVAIDVIPYGGTGRVAGPGCIVPVGVHIYAPWFPDWYSSDGQWVLAGDGADGLGIGPNPIASNTLGIRTSPYTASAAGGGDAPPGEIVLGCLIHPM